MTDQSARFVSASARRLQVTRNGRSILRIAGVPKPVVLEDTREKQPLPLFANHPNWIAGERRKSLKTGDYTVEEMEATLCLERKSLADTVVCAVT